MRWLAVIVLALPGMESGDPAFPVKSGPDGRSLVDRNGKPFLYLADTAWLLVQKLTFEEAEAYFDDRKARGFTAVQLHAVTRALNRAGHAPFAPIDDPRRPEEDYWRHVDGVFQAARARGLLVAASALWLRWGGADREGWRAQLTEDTARAYGSFLGRRYKAFDNVAWILGGDANPAEKTDLVRELARAIREEAPHHLLAYHAAREHASARVLPEEDWLDLNFAYTFGPAHRQVLGEFRRDARPRPIILADGACERGRNAGALRVREQAYRAVLSGARGGHAYAHASVREFEPGWRADLDAPGARQMGFLREFLLARAWYALVPDAGRDFLVAGGGEGEADHAPVARTEDGRLAVIYLPRPRRVTLDLARLAGPVTLRWFDPSSGAYRPVEGSPFPNAGKRDFDPPGRNAAGDPDFLLLAESR